MVVKEVQKRLYEACMYEKPNSSAMYWAAHEAVRKAEADGLIKNLYFVHARLIRFMLPGTVRVINMTISECSS